MAKMRVYELARKLGVETKVLLGTLKELDIEAKSHQSALDESQVKKVKAAVGGSAETEVAAKKTGPTVIRVKNDEGSGSPSRTKVIRRRRAAASKPEAEPESQPTEDKAVETETVEAKQPEPVKDSEAKVEEVQEEKTPELETKTVEEEPAKTTIKPRSFASAKIVRRAEPSEVKKSADLRSTEDSQGTKFTGIGTPRAGDAETSYPKREKGSKLIEEDPEEKEVKKKLVASKKRGSVSMRDLLSQADDIEGEEDPVVVKTKTVFTPQMQRRNFSKNKKNLKKTKITVARDRYRIVKMQDHIQVGELAKQLKVKAGEIIKKLMSQGVMATINQTVDFDTASLIASEYQYEVKNVAKDFNDILQSKGDKVAEEGTEVRAPIVTVMGHVDHGKTSILDAIRETEVAAKEAGGITQHIGAYSVEKNGKKITFLDTPGHEAFSSMRARGALLTDIVILVVAADDGVMPQTIEAIHHARDAGVPLIVAVNKIDKERINLDKVYKELAENEVQAEEWGGDIQFVKVSAITKQGLDDLLEAILLLAEVQELRTESTGDAIGRVVEANLDPGKGVVATMIVQHGTLRVGDRILCGTVDGKVRLLTDHLGRHVDEAGPATPVEVLGLPETPEAGDPMHVFTDEKMLKEVQTWREEQKDLQVEKSGAQSLDSLLGKMKELDKPELALIIKGDTQGSVEAIVDAIQKLENEKVAAKVIHKAVGGIVESDINLAEASGGVIFGFHVRASRGLEDVANKKGVVLKYYSIIYDLVEDIKSLMSGKLPPLREEVVIGHADVRQTISVPKIGTIAGSAITDGTVNRNAYLRLIRDDIVIYDGKIGSLRRFKDDVKEVKTGYECGIGFENYNDIKVGDRIEAYEIKEIKQELF